MKMRPYNIIILLFVGWGFNACSYQEKDVKEIHGVLEDQVDSWNKGDLEGYMQGYWDNEDLIFTGGKGINRGWQETLVRYKESYPDKQAMGELSFNDLDVQLISSESAFAVGEWRLVRIADTLNGRFTLIWRKINGHWFIIADHSS